MNPSSEIKIDNDGLITVSKTHDISDVINTTRELHNSGFHGGKDVKLAASIPLIVVESYCTRNGITFNEFMNNPAHQKNILNDPSLKAFRVWPGRV